MKIKVNEAVIVEGKYDLIKLNSVIDGTIIKTDGFGIFKDAEKKRLIRRLAEQRGLIVLTDSDGAGGVIRSYIRQLAGENRVYHLYVPQLAGKEKRKTAPSREGYLGVEGIGADCLRALFLKAGVHVQDSGGVCVQDSGGVCVQDSGAPCRAITKPDFFRHGLSGGKNAREKREKLCAAAGLPKSMSANSLLSALNLLFSYEEYEDLLKSLTNGE